MSADGIKRQREQTCRDEHLFHLLTQMVLISSRAVHLLRRPDGQQCRNCEPQQTLDEEEKKAPETKALHPGFESSGIHALPEKWPPNILFTPGFSQVKKRRTLKLETV